MVQKDRANSLYLVSGSSNSGPLYYGDHIKKKMTNAADIIQCTRIKPLSHSINELKLLLTYVSRLLLLMSQEK